ncbi:ribonuclease HII [Eilatimonas milleporae]|uniref:Ribonuclease HII n=1 Tax=Eilatimonas milleporae TaxID=911205 RepID=A0A3M0C8E5_9PROT|nr:ribonuclease HII [Eilatimonas milleporae]RMB04630.1 RNase HII [Eilatimonas milleporae]
MKDLFDKKGPSGHTGPDWRAEEALTVTGTGPVCGVDEVGRGPIAGPVVAAAVILDPGAIPDGLDDSKKLTAKRRERLYDALYAQAVAVSVAEASVAEIDRLNILAASLLAMRRAVAGLPVAPAAALVDGNQDPGLDMPTRLLVKGDSRSLSIAAASIVAKVFRDRLMARLSRDHPQYGWERNAGYGVPKHMAALRLVGASPHHRRSFAPVRAVLHED